MSTKQRTAPEFFATEVIGARRFYRNLAKTPDRALRVVAGGIEHCDTNYRIDRASFPFATIEFVSRGHGSLLLAGRTYDLGPGSVFTYKKGMAHRITSDPHSHLVKYFVAIANSGAARLIDRCGLAAGQMAQLSPADALTALFEELVWAGTRADQDSEEYCRKILECLAIRIRACLISTTEREPASVRKYQECRDYIERNFLTLRNTRDIASHCSISDVHLCHLFRRHDHQTPYRLLTRLKMNYAAALIQQSHLLIREVGEAVGYGDQFHFSRVFRDFLGVPPSEWRRMNAPVE